jgi:hypothetical protein
MEGAEADVPRKTISNKGFSRRKGRDRIGFYPNGEEE